MSESKTHLVRGGGCHVLEVQQTVRFHLEERAVRGQADVVAALGSREAQARALAARQQDDSDLAGEEGARGRQGGGTPDSCL